jgi:hypothetical protein
MAVFHHPHLTRGIVKTAKGSFVIVRGLVDVPDEIGESLGWQPIDVENHPQAASAKPQVRELATPAIDRDAESWGASMKTREREARARLIRAKAASFRSRPHMQPNE